MMEKTGAAAVITVFPVAFAVAAFFTACDKTPTGPTPGPPPVVAGIRGIEIEGPPVVHLGQTAQFSLIAQMTDGSKRDVTNEARWSGGDAVASLSEHGRVTGLQSGEIEVRAVFETYRRRKDVTVVPAGTYKLLGQVNDANVPVEGARIEVTHGFWPDCPPTQIRRGSIVSTASWEKHVSE